MTNREIRKQIHSLAWPMVGTNLLTRGVNIVDMVLVGHLGRDALAGVGVAQLILGAGTIVTFSLSVGSTVLVAFYTGAQDYEKRRSIVKTSVIAAVMFGLLLCLLGLTLSPAIATLLGAEGAVFDLCWQYVKVIWFFIVARILQEVVSSMFQGMGDSRTPLVIVGISNVIHVAVGYGLIYGEFGLPQLGVMGAAVATGCTETLSAIVLISVLIYRRELTLSARNASRGDVQKLVVISTPVVGERALTNSMQWTYNSLILNTAVGAYAAHQTGMNIEALSYLPGIAFMQAATTLVGQNLGASNVDRARRSGYQSNIIAVAVMTVFALTFFFLPHYWMMLFTSDPEVISFGIPYLKIVALTQPALAMTLVLGGALRGAGETRWVMIIALVGGWVVRIPIAVAFYTFHLGVFWLWMIMPVDWFVRAALMYWRYRKGNWKLAKDAPLGKETTLATE